MKSWYTTRDGANLQHKSQPVTNGKRIFLTEAQAKLHGDAIEKSEAPTKVEDAGVKSEYDEWQATQSASQRTSHGSEVSSDPVSSSDKPKEKKVESSK